MAQRQNISGDWITVPDGTAGSVATPTQPTTQTAPVAQNALTPQQVSELNIAAQRGTPTDLANLAYAKSTYGFTPEARSTNLTTDTLNNGGVAPTPPPQPSNVTMLGQQVANSGLTSIQQTIAEYLNQQQVANQRAQEAAQAERDTALAGLEGAMKTSNLDTMRSLEQQAGLEQKRTDLNNIMAQINSYKGALEQGLINIEGQPIAMDFIVGQQALLQRQAAAKINTLVAQAALVQDNLNFAVDTVDRYYKAASQDRQDQIERYKLLFDIADQDLINLKKDEKDFINGQIKLLEDADARQTADKDKVLQLMMDNPEAWAKANVSLDMPYEEILKRVAPQLATVAAAQDEKTLVRDLAAKYADAGIALTDTLTQAQAKLAKSKIYLDQVRGPVGSGGGGGSTTTGVDDPLIKSFVIQDADGQWVVDGDAVSNVFGTGKDAAQAIRDASALADKYNAGGSLDIEIIGEGTAPITATNSGGQTGLEKTLVNTIKSGGYFTDAVDNISRWLFEP